MQQDGGGASKLAHLRKAAEELGTTVEALSPQAASAANPPPHCCHHFEAFNDLNAGRSAGMVPNPITFEAILAWCTLHHVQFESWEVALIKRLDQVWLKVVFDELSSTDRNAKRDGIDGSNTADTAGVIGGR